MRQINWQNRCLAPSCAQESWRARCRSHAPHLPANADREFHQFRTAAPWDERGSPAGGPRCPQICRLGSEQEPRFYRGHGEETTLSYHVIQYSVGAATAYFRSLPETDGASETCRTFIVPVPGSYAPKVCHSTRQSLRLKAVIASGVGCTRSRAGAFAFS